MYLKANVPSESEPMTVLDLEDLQGVLARMDDLRREGFRPQAFSNYDPNAAAGFRAALLSAAEGGLPYEATQAPEGWVLWTKARVVGTHDASAASGSTRNGSGL